MELLGAAAIGGVLGWLVPLGTRRTWRALVASVAIVGVAAVTIGVTRGPAAGVAAAAGSLAGLLARAAWTAYLVAHARLRGEGG